MEAIEAVAALRVLIVRLDIQLPVGDGVIVAEPVAAEPDAPEVVLI